MKRVQINKEEMGWAGFLLDADAEASMPFLHRALLAESREDGAIVGEAWEKGRTIVTSNRRDFLSHIQRFQSRENQQGSRDLWGLLVVPNHQLLREKGLDSIRYGLAVLPNLERLRWPGIGFLNLYVRVTDGQKIEIRRFKRCSCCERDLPVREPWNKWYRGLPLTGTRA